MHVSLIIYNQFLLFKFIFKFFSIDLNGIVSSLKKSNDNAYFSQLISSFGLKLLYFDLLAGVHLE